MLEGCYKECCDDSYTCVMRTGLRIVIKVLEVCCRECYEECYTAVMRSDIGECFEWCYNGVMRSVIRTTIWVL